jgi:ATP-binding cassette subfamily C (CFTR/MRP) protein 4
MPIHTGTVSTFGLISYAAQVPWIFSGSVRQNVLFGQPLEEKRYWKVLDVCALEHDLKQWKHKDHTLVGEKGVILSGLLCNFWF